MLFGVLVTKQAAGKLWDGARCLLPVVTASEINLSPLLSTRPERSVVERSAVRISRKDPAQQPDKILQISPLRCAPVEMTKGRGVYFRSGDYWEQAEFFRSL